MGSFAATCCVSGLPIEAGDEVRFFLLQSSPYSEMGDHATAPHSWYVRSPPLRAKYNDYGSVEDVETGAMRDVWSEQLAIDLIEKGVGDNTCHDVAARKGMSFDGILAAAWEERLMVGRREFRSSRLPKAKIARGVPTMRRVERAIVKAGWKLGTAEGSFVVDSLRRGEVRVRVGGYADRIEPLRPLAKKLRGRYAVMLSCGSGSYSHGAELTIRPKPGTKSAEGHPVALHDKEKPVRMYLRQTMVREDVWQALLGGTVDGCGEDYKTVAREVSVYRDGAREAWKKTKAALASRPDCDYLSFVIEGALRHNPIEGTAAKNPSIGGVGLDTAWLLMVKKADLSDADRDRFLDTIAEVAFIQQRLATARQQWRPSPKLGPQCGEWGQHVDILRALLSVAEKRKAEHDAERAKWDAED